MVEGGGRKTEQGKETSEALRWKEVEVEVEVEVEFLSVKV